MKNVSEYNEFGIDTRTGMPFGGTNELPFLDRVNAKINNEWVKFVKENGHNPQFANVVVKFDDEDEEFSDFIKVLDFYPVDTENDPDDNHVIFYVEGLNGLLEINSDRIADFVITDINFFSDSY